MPTYEYACRSCDSHLEIVQRFDDEPLSTCPSCGGSLRKVFGSIGIAFKGSGFYKTDNRSSVKGEPGGTAKKAEGGDGGKDGGKETSPEKGSGDTASSGTSTPATSDAPAKSTSAKSTPSAKSA